MFGFPGKDSELNGASTDRFGRNEHVLSRYCCIVIWSVSPNLYVLEYLLANWNANVWME